MLVDPENLDDFRETDGYAGNEEYRLVQQPNDPHLHMSRAVISPMWWIHSYMDAGLGDTVRETLMPINVLSERVARPLRWHHLPEDLC